MKDGVDLYWDDAADDPGPALRVVKNGIEQTTGVEFTGWSVDGCLPGYELSCYFSGDGDYLGPDQYGVYPVFDDDRANDVARVAA